MARFDIDPGYTWQNLLDSEFRKITGNYIGNLYLRGLPQSWRYPEIDGLQSNILSKWMITRGVPHFGTAVRFQPAMPFRWDSQPSSHGLHRHGLLQRLHGCPWDFPETPGGARIFSMVTSMVKWFPERDSVSWMLNGNKKHIYNLYDFFPYNFLQIHNSQVPKSFARTE